MIQYYREEINHLYNQIERDFVNEKKQFQQSDVITKVVLHSQEILSKYRQSCLIQKGYIDLHEIIEKKYLYMGSTEDLSKKIEIESHMIKLRYVVSFLFAIIRSRSKYEETLDLSFHINKCFYISDYDWNEALEDIIFYVSGNYSKAASNIEKYLSYIFHFGFDAHLAFNEVIIKYFFRYIEHSNKVGMIKVYILQIFIIYISFLY